jgi:hypothetical protein
MLLLPQLHGHAFSAGGTYVISADGDVIVTAAAWAPTAHTTCSSRAAMSHVHWLTTNTARPPCAGADP